MKQPHRNKARLALRRAEAAERLTATAKLTPQQRLAQLDARLGKGKGAALERQRLIEMITPKAKG